MPIVHDLAFGGPSHDDGNVRSIRWTCIADFGIDLPRIAPAWTPALDEAGIRK
jgi:hypothetical protein